MPWGTRIARLSCGGSGGSFQEFGDKLGDPERRDPLLGACPEEPRHDHDATRPRRYRDLLRAGHIDDIERFGSLEIAERRHLIAERARERRGGRQLIKIAPRAAMPHSHLYRADDNLADKLAVLGHLAYTSALFPCMELP